MKRHIDAGGNANDFDAFFTEELHQDWKASFDLFNDVHEELTGDRIQLDEQLQIAEAQARSFVAAISRPSDEKFDQFLRQLRPASPLDDIFGD